MSGKSAVVALIAALVAFGYVFTLNPGMVEFQIYPGANVSTSLALILFLFFLAGFGVAAFATAFKEAFRSFVFWRHRKDAERREEAQRLVVKGRGQAVLGQTRVARKLIEKASRKAAGEQFVTLEMARVEMADGLRDRAERRLKVLLEDDPKNPEVLKMLLDLYQDREDFEGQVATLTRWLEADPNHLGALRSLRDLYRKAGNWSEAVRIQERVVARSHERDARSAERRVLTELRFQDARTLGPERARGVLERLVKDDESFAPAHAALGDVLLGLGDNEGAAQTWLRGYQSTGQIGLLLKAEASRLEQGKAEDMLTLYKKLGKKGGAAPLLRARLLLALERSKEALELLDQTRSEAGESRAGRLLLGEALYRLRSFDEAAKTFRDAVCGGEDKMAFPFTCRSCAKGTRRWDAACPHCGTLDGLNLDLESTPTPAPVPAVA